MAYIAAECRKYFVATQRKLTVWVYPLIAVCSDIPLRAEVYDVP